MATTIYDEPWSPSNINCNWKPEKLSRYSFVTNLINFGAPGVKLGYEQNSNNEIINSAMNLTDYISVSAYRTYYFTCEQNLTRGIRYIAFFTSGKVFLSSKTFNPGITSSLNGSFYTPANCAYVRITFYKEAWEKCSLRASYSNSLVSGEKDMTPLDIVDNKEGAQIYQDLHFEVYVKAEAIIKNFVDCFGLRAFQTEANFKFQAFTPDYYDELASPWEANHVYKVGDIVSHYIYISSFNYCCKTAHTSGTSFDETYWDLIDNSRTNFLNIIQNIKEENYSLDNPWVAHLVFKNLWGCDLTNYLKTFVKSSNFCLTYKNAFAENLKNTVSNYDEFFDKGYFKNNDDILGARFLLGESWKEDSLLGDNKLNNYTNVANTYGTTAFEQKHSVGSDWNYSDDSVIKDYFDTNIYEPFDHFYRFIPKVGMPFFKERVFEDCLIQIALQRKDVLGNIFQRFVQLPTLVTFTNNLIKVYFRRGADTSIGRVYDSEYLASNYEYKYTGSSSADKIACRSTIWCPNVERLSISSTILGPLGIVKKPELVTKNGQLGVMEWIFSAGTAGTKMLATHVLEYSDGENYDKFIYIESITMV